MKHIIQITEKDETARNLVKLLRSLSKKNRNIDFVTEELLDDILDLHLAKRAKKNLRSAVSFNDFMAREKSRRKLT